MLRLTSLSNKYARRTLRALHAQTQAYPYPARLSSTVDRSLTNPFTLTAHAGKAAIWPGQVAEKLVGNVVQVQATGEATARPFGLFANFVGGSLSDIPAEDDNVGVWRGPGAVFEILAPAFVDTGASALAAAEAGTVATEVFGVADATGRIAFDAGARANGDVVRLLARYSANAVEVELQV